MIFPTPLLPSLCNRQLRSSFTVMDCSTQSPIHANCYPTQTQEPEENCVVAQHQYMTCHSTGTCHHSRNFAFRYSSFLEWATASQKFCLVSPLLLCVPDDQSRMCFVTFFLLAMQSTTIFFTFVNFSGGSIPTESSRILD